MLCPIWKIACVKPMSTGKLSATVCGKSPEGPDAGLILFEKGDVMKVAFIIYDGMTVLDFTGVYDPVTRLKTMGFMKDLEYEVCAFQARIKSFEGLEIAPDRVGNALTDYDYVIVPGGNGIMDLADNQAFLDWIASAGERTTLVSVCGGSLVFGFAGLLRGRTATTHLTLTGFLEKLTPHVSRARIVEDGGLITARGVTSAIDLGLYLCEKIAGKDARAKIQQQMDYLHYTAQ
jgi:cyclohexyl-isocyanide hydratase